MEQGRGVYYAVIAGVMWGVLAIALKVTLNNYDLSLFTIVWFRFSIAFVLLALFMLFKHPEYFRVFYKPPLKLIGATLCIGFNYYSYMRGLDYTTPSNAQIFAQIGPVLFAAAGIYIFKERINFWHYIGFAVVLLGLGLFYGEQIDVMDSKQGYITGIFWVVASAVAWVFYAVWQKELLRTYPANQMNLFLYGVCSLIYIPMIKLSGFGSLDIQGWMLAIFLGLNTLIAYGAIALSFRFLDSHKVSVIVAMNPIITFTGMYMLAMYGYSIVEPEHFSFPTLLGAALALGGTIFIILFTRKK